MGEDTMTEQQFEQMKQFSVAMTLARAMLAQHIITEEDYDILEAGFAEKYHPPFVLLSL